MKVLVTGSSGLIGSEAVAYFDARGDEVHGVDSNMRMDFFGAGGDTRPNRDRLLTVCTDFRHHDLDIRDRAGVAKLCQEIAFDLLIHCAAQPSHDLAASRPFDDFDTNAVGTMNLLEGTRLHRPDAVFIHVSTNKVYGDAPNEIPLEELDTRWDYAPAEFAHGIDENFRIDQSTHSLFGASKAAADLLAQEYGRYFGMNVGVFRGGCLTGPQHAGVELHGFLSYLMKVGQDDGHYRIYGYKGKQVRDQIHCFDVIRAFHEFFKAPRPGEVYNIGGGRENSVSVLEAISTVESITGRDFSHEYVDEARVGDHICYYSDLRKLRSHYPDWDLTKSLDDIWEDLAATGD